MKIIKNGDYIGTDEGNLYLDGYSVEGECPYCKTYFSKKLVKDTYIYDSIQNNTFKPINIWCNTCEKEFDVNIKIEFKVNIQ